MTWSGECPLEIVRRLTTPTGLVFLMRAKMRGAEFQPLATLSTRGTRWTAEIWFREPIGPERQSSVVVALAVMAEGAA